MMKFFWLMVILLVGLESGAVADGWAKRSTLGAVKTTGLAALAEKGKQQAAVGFLGVDTLFAEGLQQIRAKNWQVARITFEKVLILKPGYPGAAFFKTFALDKLRAQHQKAQANETLMLYKLGAMLACTIIAMLVIGIIFILKILHRYEMFFLLVRTFHFHEQVMQQVRFKRLPKITFWRK